ncbi:MAG: hypothetical protein WBX22_29800 [Silvibacterium sp.]
MPVKNLIPNRCAPRQTHANPRHSHALWTSGGAPTPRRLRQIFPAQKGSFTFCVKVDTSIIWHSDTKQQNFVVDMGPNEPFDPPGDIIGGSDKTATVRAKAPGCYRFCAGAYLSGDVYGMCGNGTAGGCGAGV